MSKWLCLKSHTKTPSAGSGQSTLRAAKREDPAGRSAVSGAGVMVPGKGRGRRIQSSPGVKASKMPESILSSCTNFNLLFNLSLNKKYFEIKHMIY